MLIIIFHDRLLHSLDKPLLDDLEKVVRQKQLEKLPVSKSNLLLEMLEERNPTLGEERRKAKDQLMLAFESSSLPSSYSGSLLQSLSSSFSKRGNMADRRGSESGGTGCGSHKSQRREEPQEQLPLVTQPSPPMRPIIQSDFIFDMEDEPSTSHDWRVVKGKTKYGSPVGSYNGGGGFDEHMRLPSSKETTQAGSYRRDSFATSATPTESHLTAARPTAPMSSSVSKASPLSNASTWGKSNEYKKSMVSSSPSWKPNSPSGISLGLQLKASESYPATPLRHQENSSAAKGVSSPMASTSSIASLLSSPVTSASSPSATMSSPAGFAASTKLAVSQKTRKKQREQEIVSSPPLSSSSRSASHPWSTPVKDTRSSSASFASPQLFPLGPQTSFATTAATNSSQLAKKLSAVSAPAAPANPSSSTSSTSSATAMSSSSIPTWNNSSRKASPTPLTPTAIRAPKSTGELVATTTTTTTTATTATAAAATAAAIPPELQLSLAEIIEQQRIEQEIITARAHQKQSIKQLQEEEEFASWWAAESERVQAELQKQEKAAAAKFSSTENVGKRNSKGRGAPVVRGGRGGGGAGRGGGYRKGKAQQSS